MKESASHHSGKIKIFMIFMIFCIFGDTFPHHLQSSRGSIELILSQLKALTQFFKVSLVICQSVKSFYQKYIIKGSKLHKRGETQNQPQAGLKVKVKKSRAFF